MYSHAEGGRQTISTPLKEFPSMFCQPTVGIIVFTQYASGITNEGQGQININAKTMYIYIDNIYHDVMDRFPLWPPFSNSLSIDSHNYGLRTN